MQTIRVPQTSDDKKFTHAKSFNGRRITIRHRLEHGPFTRSAHQLIVPVGAMCFQDSNDRVLVVQRSTAMSTSCPADPNSFMHDQLWLPGLQLRGTNVTIVVVGCDLVYFKHSRGSIQDEQSSRKSHTQTALLHPFSRQSSNEAVDPGARRLRPKRLITREPAGKLHTAWRPGP